MEEFPKELQDFYDETHEFDSDCGGCSFCCCFQSGFALRKNVEYIYQIYKSGKIIRNDYQFIPGLSLENFISIYFDVVIRTEFNLTMYFPRHLSCGNEPLKVPFKNDGDFYDIRDEMLNDPINEAKGCIFLEKSINLYDRSSRKCILHDNTKNISLYAKPIDCIFLICNHDKRVKHLDISKEQQYFEMLGKYYPD